MPVALCRSVKAQWWSPSRRLLQLHLGEAAAKAQEPGVRIAFGACGPGTQ